MEQLTLKQYNAIPEDYRGIFEDYQGTSPELKGKRCMLKLVNNATCLVFEGIHFEIVDDNKGE